MIKKIIIWIWSYYLTTFGILAMFQPFFSDKKLLEFLTYALVISIIVWLIKLLYEICKNSYQFGNVELKISHGDLIKTPNSTVLVPFVENNNSIQGTSLYSDVKKNAYLSNDICDVPNIDEIYSLNGSKFYCIKVKTVSGGETAKLAIDEYFNLCFKIAQTLNFLSGTLDRYSTIFIPNIASRYQVTELDDIDRLVFLMKFLSIYQFSREVKINLVLSTKKSYCEILEFKRKFSSKI